MLLHWIWFAERPRVKAQTRRKLLEHFRTAEAVYEAGDEELGAAGTLTEAELESLGDKSTEGAAQILADCEKEGLRVLTWADRDYPDRLRNIFDPPAVLYYKGELPDFDAVPAIGIVGTRRASVYGLSAAEKMGYQIAKGGGLVISGMAAGIDAAATEGALRAGKTAVGVLGCGADVIYPRSNKKLFADMERYGCLISEFAPGTPPNKWNFPRRNRIVSGLSCGVVVVEAPEKSGALITAGTALDQGRDVFVIPGNVDVESFVGSNRLLRQGAVAVGSGWDVLSEYEALFPGRIVRDENAAEYAAHGRSAAPSVRTGRGKTVHKKAVDKSKTTLYIDESKQEAPEPEAPKRPALTEEEQKVAGCVTAEPGLVDDVIARCGLPAGRVLMALTMLEIKKVIRRHPGKRVSLAEHE